MDALEHHHRAAGDLVALLGLPLTRELTWRVRVAPVERAAWRRDRRLGLRLRALSDIGAVGRPVDGQVAELREQLVQAQHGRRAYMPLDPVRLVDAGAGRRRNSELLRQLDRDR